MSQYDMNEEGVGEVARDALTATHCNTLQHTATYE